MEKEKKIIDNKELCKIVFKMNLLEHHPPCSNFKNHTISIGKLKLCIGCFVGYPATFIGFFLSSNVFSKSTRMLQLFLSIIGILFAFSIKLKNHKKEKSKSAKIVEKAFIGLFLGILTNAITHLLPFNEWNFFTAAIIVFVVSLPVFISHSKKNIKVCQKCEIKKNCFFSYVRKR